MNLKNEQVAFVQKSKTATELIKERNEKSLFLVLFLPWLTNIFVSFSSTSQGYVLLLFPKKIEETIPNFALRYFQDEIGYIAVVALCNFIVDLILFSILTLQKNKFKVNKLKSSLLLLFGHCVAASVFMLGLANSNFQIITKALNSLIILTSSYYVLLRFFPRKYIDILSEYWQVYIFRELHFLSKRDNTSKIEKAIKNRLRLYVFSLLLSSMSVLKEKELLILIQKWRSLDFSGGNKLRLSIVEFSDYLHAKFNIQSLNLIDFEKQNFWEKILMRFDQVVSFTVYSSAVSPQVADLVYRALHPVNTNDFGVISLSEDKNLKKIVKYHLSQARDADVISARQKIYIFIAVSFVYLISPTVLFLINFRNSGLWFEGDRFAVLLLQYFSTIIFALSFTYNMQRKYRVAGMGVYVSSQYFNYFVNSLVLLIFLITAIIGNEVIYNYVSTVFLERINLILICILFFQFFLLFLFLKPPTELKNPVIATSLLVRELMLLRLYVLGSYSLQSRRQIARHIYFSKKYFGYIERKLTYYRFDTKSQKDHLRNYFNSVEEYLDKLSSDIKLGTIADREKIISQIEVIIHHVAIEKIGDIPNFVPEIKSYLGSKSIQPKQLTYIGKLIQVFDTSWLARSLVLVIIFIIINLLNPSWWQYIQNYSSLFGIFSP